MKKQAIKKLCKDIVIAVIAFLVVFFIVKAWCGNADEAIGIAIFFTGLPFGWKWASKVFTAISGKALFFKLVFSLFLGFIAIFVVIIGDIINCFIAPKEEKV